MKAEYRDKPGCPQRDSAEHEGYAGAQSIGNREVNEQDGADLLERILSRENLNRAYKRVRANHGAPGIDGMTVEDALPWLERIRPLYLLLCRRTVDVKDFNAGIVWCNENGLKTGSMAATRGEVLMALYIAAGSPTVEDTSILSRFKDASSIPADLAAIAAWAAQNGILRGNMDGTAALGANVTRGQACALAGRTMGALA